MLGSARAGVRKTVTVLFADAPDLAGGHDLESRVRLAAAFYDAVREVLTSHGGTVERSAGDAVMAVFGIPASRDDDARRAAAAALALLEADLPGAPALAVGINSGEVLAGSPEGGEELAVGDPVVVAARLQRLALQGEVLLGPATVAMLGRTARLGPSRSVALKGRTAELVVSPLLGLVEGERGPRGPFVGRESETRMLATVLDRSLTARVPQLVTVLGEAGTGKSRLVEEAFADGRVRVLTGVCRAYGAGSAWAPLVEIAEQFTGVPTGSSRDELLATAVQRGQLNGGVSVLGAMAGGGSPVTPGDSAISHSEMTAAVLRLLGRVVSNEPLVVVIEDVHLAEPALLDLVLEVLRTVEDVPLLLICTARPELLDVRQDWGRGLRHVLGLTLRPLGEEAARQLAEHLLPGDPQGVAAVLGPAGGNPLFLEQLAQARAEGTDEAALSVGSVLEARLDLLPLETRQVLERAAVIGPSGRTSDLVPLCATIGSLHLEAELATLARRDLLEVADGRFRFASELVREVASAGLTRDDRAGLHQIRGLVLAAQGANAQAGFHFEQASLLLRQTDPAKSAAMGKQAAARMAAAGLRSLTGDLVAAADLLTRAIALMPVDEPRRIALLPELARAKMLAGDLVGAEPVLDEAITQAEAIGNCELAAHGRLARLDLMRSTDPERAYDELPALLDQVLPVLTAAHDDRGLALAYQLQASSLRYRVRWGAMAEPLARALHHAELAQDRRLVEVVQILQTGSLLHGPTHLDETRHRLELLLEQAGSSPAHRASVEARLAQTLALQGNPIAARSSLVQVRRIFRDLGRELSALAAASIAGTVELLAGEPERAAALLEEACAGLLARGDLARLTTLSTLRAEACWRSGDRPAAQAAIVLAQRHVGPRDVISQVRLRSVRAKLLAVEGRREEARTVSASALQLVSTVDDITTQGDVLASAAEVQELLGNPDAAQPLLRDAVARYQRKGALQSVARLAPRLLVQPSAPLQEVIRVSSPPPG